MGLFLKQPGVNSFVNLFLSLLLEFEHSHTQSHLQY